jgi:hypothetical protein
MSSFRQFVFDSYTFNEESKILKLNYAIDDTLHFTETFRFDFPFAQYDRDMLDRAVQLLFFIAGVSYYKTYIPPEIIVRSGEIDESTAAFLSKTYQKGLGEFWYVNQLDPNTAVLFPQTTQRSLNVLSNNGEGLLVGVGGGKDSLVAIELLQKKRADITTWSLNHRPQLEPLVKRVGLPHAWVERTWDPSLAELAKSGAYNGHIPISAIFASVGTIVAILSGKQDVVVSNEQSASEPTLTYRGVPINHQYSKSIEFEQDFQNYLKTHFGESIRYYSFLRPLSEVRIAELFAAHALQTYKGVFSSCNRAYVHGSDHMFWCGECPKCAFTFLILAPFVDRPELETLFGGKNLLLDPGLEPTYRQLLGIEGNKPFECVGEIKESRAAMQLARSKYPELNKYEFELPNGYDFRALGTHKMPIEMYEILLNAVQPG